MDLEVKKHIENVDAWIKQIRSEFAMFEDVSEAVDENIDNIQHNYQLIYELKSELSGLRQEINALKLIQIITLKKEKKVKN